MNTLVHHTTLHLFAISTFLLFVLPITTDAALYTLQSAHIDGTVHTLPERAPTPRPTTNPSNHKSPTVIPQSSEQAPLPTPQTLPIKVINMPAAVTVASPKRVWLHKEIADAHITSLVVDVITTESASVHFTTDEQAYSYIEYVVISDDAFERQDVASAPILEHKTTITGLYPGVEYKLRIITAREDSSIIEQRETTFKTLPITTLPSIKLHTGDAQQRITPVPVRHSKPLFPSKRISITNIVSLIKVFDANSFAELYAFATASQRSQMQEVEPALFTQSGLLNADVFRSLNPTKHALLLSIVDALPNISVANDLLSTESKLDASVQSDAPYRWSAYAGSKLHLTLAAAFFVQEPTYVTMHLDDSQYRLTKVGNLWEAMIPVPYTSGLHAMRLEAEFRENSDAHAEAVSMTDEYQAQLQVSNLPDVVGQEGSQWGSERVRLSSTLVDLYKRTEGKTGSAWWQRYTQKPYITNQNGEFAAALPVGEYKIVITNDDGSQSTAEQSIVHAGGMLSASVLMGSGSSAAHRIVRVLQYMLMLLLLIAFGLTVHQGNVRSLAHKILPKFFILVLFFISSISMASAAQQTIDYSGVLATGQGIAASAQRVNMNFSFYDAEFDGKVLSSFSQYVNVASGGSFKVALPVNNLKGGKEYWVALRVGNDDLGRSKVVLSNVSTLPLNTTPMPVKSIGVIAWVLELGSTALKHIVNFIQ